MATAPADLLSHLVGHTPLDAAEAEHQRQIVALVRHAGTDGPASAWSRSRFEPGHLTGSAFLVARRPEPALLMVRHPTLGRWLQPGGHVEAEDAIGARGSLATVAARELLEETGLSFAAEAFSLVDLDVHAIPANPRKGEPAHLHLDCRYLLLSDTRPVATLSPSDPCECRWWPLDEASAFEPGLARLASRVRSRLV